MRLDVAKAVACDGKFKHEKRVDAIKQAKNGKIKLNVYRCSFCGFFHVGHSSEKDMDNHKRFRERVRKLKGKEK